MAEIMEILGAANDISVLITGLIGLITTGIGVFFAIKNWITVLKEKNSNAIWTMIMDIADKAMEEAEQTALSGADKKTMVIEAIKVACITANLPIDSFIDQVDDYIEQTIKFVNDMKKAKENRDSE